MLGVTRTDKIINWYIRRKAQVADKVREVRLTWFRHVQQGDDGYIRQSIKMWSSHAGIKAEHKEELMDVVRERRGLVTQSHSRETLYNIISRHDMKPKLGARIQNPNVLVLA